MDIFADHVDGLVDLEAAQCGGFRQRVTKLGCPSRYNSLRGSGLGCGWCDWSLRPAAGSLVNKTANGKTPMIAAIDTVSRKCMRLLYKAGADRRGALAYATENLLAAKVVSSDFVKCILEDAESNRIVPSDEPVVKQKTREEGFNTLARYAFKEKDFESAEGCYSVIIALDPDDATAFSNRSLCWLLMGDGGKALIDADECRKRRPDWPKACYRQGAALMLLEDYQKACERFSEGLKLDPGNAEMEDALRKASDEYKKMS
uniref:Uncharacterized protein n=1 Tax=Avena sativa TaxID=4498 RepID=A0ACD5TZX1_AVESA